MAEHNGPNITLGRVKTSDDRQQKEEKKKQKIIEAGTLFGVQKESNRSISDKRRTNKKTLSVSAHQA